MICQLRLPYKDITNYVIRKSKRAMITLEPDTTRYIPIRFPILDKYNRYIFKSDMDIVNVYFKECVLPDKLSGDSRLFSLRNVSKESITVTVLKGIRLGHIKYLESPHYSAILPMSIHKISSDALQEPISTVSTSRISVVFPDQTISFASSILYIFSFLSHSLSSKFSFICYSYLRFCHFLTFDFPQSSFFLPASSKKSFDCSLHLFFSPIVFFFRPNSSMQ